MIWILNSTKQSYEDSFQTIAVHYSQNENVHNCISDLLGNIGNGMF